MMHVNTDELAKAMNRVRARRTGNLKSNYFFGPLRATEFPLWATDHSLVFLDREHDFQRVYFMSVDVDELSHAVGAISEGPLVADYVTRADDHDTIDAMFSCAGFTKVAIYQRMMNNHLAARQPRSKITCAEPDEAAVLFDQLCQHFNVRLDHIPERDQFTELVLRRQVLVHRRRTGIIGYAVYQLHGRRADLKFWYSQPNGHPAVALKLLADFFTDMAAKGITTSSLWVQTNKRREIGVYQNLGYESDGLITHVYVKE